MPSAESPGVVILGDMKFLIYRRKDSVYVMLDRCDHRIGSKHLLHDDPLRPLEMTDQALAEHFLAEYEAREKRRASDDLEPALPELFRTVGEENPVPAGLVGATVVGFGRLSKDLSSGKDGCELVIDYIPQGTSTRKRLVLGFTELGMWVENEYTPEKSDG